MSSLRIIAVIPVVLAAATMLYGQGLPPVPVPPENPLTPEKVLLGKILFWDEQLSSDNTVSCGTCHRPEAGGADPRLATNPGRDGLFGTPDDVVGSPGLRRADSDNRFIPDGLFGHAVQVTGRATPSFIGVQWQQSLFWDGRATPQFFDPDSGVLVQLSQSGLESQAVGPIVSNVEMGHDDRAFDEVAVKLLISPPLRLATNLPADVQAGLATSPTYADLFQAAFGDPLVTSVRIGQAIASYERSLVPNQTPFDRFVAGNPTALTAGQIRGLQVFSTVGQCNFCHAPPFFTDSSFHNIGVRPASEDPGRAALTGNPADLGAMKTPGLRNWALKPVYMHNGRFTTVEQVVDFYIRGGDFQDNLSPFITPLNLTAQQRLDLIDFLENGLTDPRVAAGTAPFDRPTLFSERVPSGSNLIGTGVSGGFGIVPELLADSPLTMGDFDVKLGISGGFGGAQVHLAVSPAPAVPGSSFGGLPLYIDPTEILVLPNRLQGIGPGAGYGTFVTFIQPNPALVGTSFYVQALLEDPLAPLGYTVTSGARLEVY